MRTSRTKRDLTWHRDRNAVAMDLKDRHPDEFRGLYETALLTAAGSTRKRQQSSAYSTARTQLVQAHHNEYLQMLGVRRNARGKPFEPDKYRRAKKPVSLVKKTRAARSTIDPLDCKILFDRGLSVPEIAKADGCTRAAVMRVLVPMLYTQRSPNAAWWESERQMSTYDMSQILNVPGIELRLYLPAEAEAA